MMTKWGQFVFQAVVLAILIPWGWQINTTVARLSADMQENRAWHASHLEIAAKEKESLRLQVMSDMEKITRALIERTETKQDAVRQELRDTDRVVRDTAARIGVLADSVSSLSSTVAQLKANVVTALSDLDFRRNETQAKGK